jgi:putative ABC transport system substrate-binding protein
VYRHRKKASALRWTVLFLLLFSAVGVSAKSKVAVVMSRLIPPYQQALTGFEKELDCDTIVFDLQKKPDLQSVAKEIKSSNPDLLLAIGSTALKLAKQHIKKTPVVFTMVLKPGKLPSNVCGVSMTLPSAVHLKGLKLIAPKVKSVGIVYNPKHAGKRVAEFKKAAGGMGLKIVSVAANSKKEAFSAIKLLAGRVDSLWMVMDQDVVANFNLLQSLSIKEKVPLATFSYKYVEMGALVALAPKFEDLGKQAGQLAKQLVAGTSPQKLGVASPTNFYYAINVNTALKIGVGVPPEVLKKDHKLYK